MVTLDADADSDCESTTSASTAKTFLTSTSTTRPSLRLTPTTTTAASTPTPTSPLTPHPPDADDPLLSWTPLTHHAPPTPGKTYRLLHVASRRALSLLHGTPTLVPAAGQILGCPNWTLTTSRGYLGLRSCASATFLGRDLPGNVVAVARGHGSWEAFVVVPAASVSLLDYDDAGEGYYVLMCINFVAGCLERVGVRVREDGGDGLGILLDGVGEGAVWEFDCVGG
ncbi:hypothetical protein QBC39DRAFT_380091 [Podospora conica]|nr:hypothetical protein QBC39DRAFT_380091 [Schizothecium conicum]